MATDLEGLEEAMQGVDVVVQMAADPRGDADWESVLTSNIIGARNVFRECSTVHRSMFPLEFS